MTPTKLWSQETYTIRVLEMLHSSDHLKRSGYTGGHSNVEIHFIEWFLKPFSVQKFNKYAAAVRTSYGGGRRIIYYNYYNDLYFDESSWGSRLDAYVCPLVYLVWS